LSSKPGATRVRRRSSSFLAGLGQAALVLGAQKVGVRQPVEDVVAFPVAPGAHVVDGFEQAAIRLRDNLVDLGLAPDVVPALLAFGIGVVARGEAAVGRAHVGQNPDDRFLDSLPEQFLAGDLPVPGQPGDQLGIVVEHLLEMRHQPAMIDRVAGEAAGEMVVDAALADVLRGHGHRGNVALVAGRQPHAAQELEYGGLRELRRTGEAAGDWVDGLEDDVRGVLEHLLRELRAGRGGGIEVQCLLQGAGVGIDLVALLAPDARDLVQHVGEARTAVAAFLREIGAAPERRAVGREKHGQRPAALLAKGMQGIHIDLVDVGALLAIDFDADEVLVHDRSRLVVLEALVGHDMAPVAGRIADRQGNRLVLAGGELERPGAPGLPVDRIVLVLEQIGAGFAVEFVSHAP
jgi:hypothetical protein